MKLMQISSLRLLLYIIFVTVVIAYGENFADSEELGGSSEVSLAENFDRDGLDLNKIENNLTIIASIVGLIILIVGYITGFLTRIYTYLKNKNIKYPRFFHRINRAFQYKFTKFTGPLQKKSRVRYFTNREDELNFLLNNLQNGQSVALCGPEGMGKTALATEAIWRLSPENEPPACFPDGIVFHNFQESPRSIQAFEAIARAYRHLNPGVEDTSPVEAARRALSGRKALLVLDGAEAAEDLEKVLDVAESNVVLITTSHNEDALRSAEWRDVLPLPPEKAVKLLRAWGGDYVYDTESGEKPALEICERLGGLPLAVCLAGKDMKKRRTYAYEYLDWLKKEPLKAQKLVQQLIERGMEHICEQSQKALGIVGVLSLEPFESHLVTKALAIEQHEADISLGELVDYDMLLRLPDTRYQVTHALLHTYAQKRLVPAQEALSRLVDYYDDLARENYDELYLHSAHILALQSACLTKEDWKSVRRLTKAIETYLDLNGYWSERATALENGIKAAKSDGSRSDEAAFLNLLGSTKKDLGEIDVALKISDAALSIAEEIGDHELQISALCQLGFEHFSLSKYEDAKAFYKKALNISESIGNVQGEGDALKGLGTAYRNLGDASKSIECQNRHLEIVQKSIDDQSQHQKFVEKKLLRRKGIACGNLGLALIDLGDLENAEEYHKEQLEISRDIGDKKGEGAALTNLGRTYTDQGNIDKAIHSNEQAIKILHKIKYRMWEGFALGNMGLAYAAQGEHQKAVSYYDSSQNILHDIGYRREEGNVLSNKGRTYAAQGNHRGAIKLFEQALEISREIGDRRGEGNAQYYMSLSLHKLGEVTQAIKCASDALLIYQQIKSPYDEQVQQMLKTWGG